VAVEPEPLSERREPLSDRDGFHAIELRVGTVREARRNEAARKPSYMLRIDFGPLLGERASSAQLAENYRPEELVGRQVVCVVNLPPLRVAGVESQVLVLGALSAQRGTILLVPERPVEDGSRIA
jgi:tRNA-binding protein